MAYDQARLLLIWQKGRVIKGRNPNLYRCDCYGNIIYWHSYGQFTTMGWEVDHSKPKCEGGTDHLNNLQPMQTLANRVKSGKY